MIEFHSPSPQDRAWVLPLLAAESLPLCDYSFPVLFCWQDAYQTRIARLGDRLLVRLKSSLGSAYLWPAGQGDPTPALEALAADAAALGEPLRFICLTLYHKNWLTAYWPGRMVYEAARDSFDYLYSVDRLSDLPGKKLHAKRNHLHRFDDACPGWRWVPLQDSDVPGCLALDAAWHRAALGRETLRNNTTLDDERRALALAFDHRKTLGLDGVVVRWQDQILAFALGAPLTDTVYDVHFERAGGSVQGDYAAVNRSFARYVRDRYPEIRYLNREDDMGVPGLRKAKLSYYPEYLQVNFCAVATGADQ